MLTDLQIAVIGGDASQLEIIRKLTELMQKLYYWVRTARSCFYRCC